MQAEVDVVDKAAQPKSKEDKTPMQAGDREYPSHFPAQHQTKSGSDELLEPKPMFDAPGYKGSQKLKGMVALIAGGDSGIGRAVAVLFAREGADVAICYLEEKGDAAVTKAAVEKEGARCILIQGHVSNSDFCKAAVWTPLNPADRQAEDVAKFGTTSAMHRAAQPEEIAPAFVFMAAPCCSSYITGEILPVIGGYGA